MGSLQCFTINKRHYKLSCAARCEEKNYSEYIRTFMDWVDLVCLPLESL